MDASTAIDVGERTTKLVTDGPTAFAAAVFALAFVGMLVLFTRQTSARATESKEVREVAVKLAVATHSLLEVVERHEEREAKRQRRRPSTNPGVKPREGA